MTDFIEFCLYVLKEIVGTWFSLDIGGYTFGDFLVGVLVIAIFISSLVISFRHRTLNSSDVSARPPESDEGGKHG